MHNHTEKEVGHENKNIVFRIKVQLTSISYMSHLEQGSRIKFLVASGLNIKLCANKIALKISALPFPGTRKIYEISTYINVFFNYFCLANIKIFECKIYNN